MFPEIWFVKEEIDLLWTAPSQIQRSVLNSEKNICEETNRKLKEMEDKVEIKFRIHFY